MKKNLYMYLTCNLEMRLLIILLLVILSIYNVSAVYVGIADGYVRDWDGSLVSGADVTARVSGCSGAGCSSTSISESTGYYVAANLNIPAQGGVQVTAVKGLGKGVVTVSANQYSIAHANVVLCYTPSSPVLTPVSNTHTTGITFQWVSGTDPKGLAQYDQFQLDSKTENLKSPVTKQVSLGKHTWQVRTCNSYCCSAWVSNSFSVGNIPPSSPIANWTAKTGFVVLSWTSGIDPDNDPIYDEFQMIGQNITSPAFSPMIVLAQPLIVWQVRTCDNLKACSAWVTVYSVTCQEINKTCPNITEINETLKMLYNKMRTLAARAISGLYCNGIMFNETYLNKIDLKLGDNKKISIYGDNFSLTDIEYCPWCYDGLQNYDETGADCGGSCPDCSEIPFKIRQNYIYFLIALVIIIIIAIYILYRKYKKSKEQIKIKKPISQVLK
jgi:hypothetical protein